MSARKGVLVVYGKGGKIREVPIHPGQDGPAAGQHQTSYHATDATDATMTIGIRGSDAAERISQLRRALAKLAAKHGWTFRDAPR